MNSLWNGVIVYALVCSLALAMGPLPTSRNVLSYILSKDRNSSFANEEVRKSLDSVREKMTGHFLSLSQELSTLNKDLTNITDQFSLAMKNVTADIASRATTNVLDSIEQVWQKFNQTIASVSSNRPTLVIHFIDSKTMSLAVLTKLVASEKQLLNSGLRYHIIYFQRDSNRGNCDIAMLRGLFTNESITIIPEANFQRFLDESFSPSGYSFPSIWKRKWRLDYLLLYWLSLTNSLSIEDNGLSSLFGPQIWVIDSHLSWEGDIARILATISAEDGFFPSDYLVLSRNKTMGLHFGPFDRSNSGREVSQFLANIFRSLVNVRSSSELSQDSITSSNGDNFSKNLNESDYMDALENQIPRRPVISRYSLPFIYNAFQRLTWKNLDVRKPLVYHLLQNYKSQSQSSLACDQPRFVCSDLREILERKGLLRLRNDSQDPQTHQPVNPKSTVPLPLLDGVFGDDSSKPFSTSTGSPISLSQLTIDPQSSYFYFSD
jgi:hypothetical protein